jgi:hypothetical protein
LGSQLQIFSGQIVPEMYNTSFAFTICAEHHSRAAPDAKLLRMASAMSGS